MKVHLILTVDYPNEPKDQFLTDVQEIHYNYFRGEGVLEHRTAFEFSDSGFTIACKYIQEMEITQ